MLFRIFSEYSVQYYHCNFSKYVTRMPFLLPDFHSNAIIRRWRTYENIPCLLYWLLSVIDINHACSKIFICSNLFFFGIVYNFCYLSYDNRTCESSESRSGLPREPYLHAEDIPHTATQPYMCCIFYLH